MTWQKKDKVKNRSRRRRQGGTPWLQSRRLTDQAVDKYVKKRAEGFNYYVKGWFLVNRKSREVCLPFVPLETRINLEPLVSIEYPKCH